MLRRVRTSISRKIMLLVLVTTASALLLSAAGLVAYDLRGYERQWTDDLDLQAEILARASAPALAFDDHQTAEKDLSIIRAREEVLAAAIYTDAGRLFATYLKKGEPPESFPMRPEVNGYHISGDEIVVFRRVVERGEPLGTVYIRARYLPWDRVLDYLAILGVVMVASLALSSLVFGWLQRGVTAPILEVARVAREVMHHRDYALRARKTSEDEIGELVDAFNGMLAESGRRAEALREADRRKDEFLATLAHELRNPLAPLRNAVEILRTPQSTPEMQERALGMMERQLRQMVRLVDDLLDVSRITTGKLTVRKSVFDLREAVRDAIETVRPFIDSRKHELDVRLAEEALPIDGDRARLAQVIGNLLHNAAKYTEPGGRIAVAAAAQGTDAVVRVQDSGIGLDERSIANIFEMFVQVDRSLTRAQAGLGVGLTLARRLVGLHDGTITAYSEGLGHGSEFIVRLPRADRPPQEPRAPASTRAAHEDRPKRILLADDNVDFARSLAAVLERNGHEVRIAHDGAEALRIAADFSPQFAFLDIGMPKVHGYEVARRLKATPTTSDCVLVAVTGWGQEDDRRRARDAGFDRHLVKPIDPQQLETVLGGSDSMVKADQGS
ncbi:MAG TPA: ATP-binding protein [Usitatibacter sp.]|nr:ATP-binding protein [Usitatibacter sp.]